MYISGFDTRNREVAWPLTRFSTSGAVSNSWNPRRARSWNPRRARLCTTVLLRGLLFGFHVSFGEGRAACFQQHGLCVLLMFSFPTSGMEDASCRISVAYETTLQTSAP